MTTTVDSVATAAAAVAAREDLPPAWRALLTASFLTGADLARICAALAAARAPSTRATYAHAWRVFERWCAGRELPPLPATPAAVCAYLAERAGAGLALGTLDVACSAIADRHRQAGQPDPITHEAVRQVRQGLRRTLGTAPRRRARPLDTAEVRRMLAHIDRATGKGARDAALILLGYAAALRCSEIAALTLADLDRQPGGLLVHLRAAKTDPEHRGQVVGVAHGSHPATDPITALEAWLAVRGSAAGPVFTSFRGVHGTGRVRLDPISAVAVADTVHERAEAAGLPADRITGHSLRAGHATTAAAAGAGLDRIAAQTRHRRLAVLVERYIRPVDVLAVTTSKDLGL